MKKTSLVALLLSLNLSAFAQKDLAAKINAISDKEYPKLDALYKHFHSNPELSFFETKTAARLAEELRASGFEVTEHFGGNGIVAVMKNGPGKTILVRADMDALPVKEETGLPYASKVTTRDAEGKEVSVMHACGHDIHITVLTGLAKVLSQLKAEWKGTIVLIGQPAEERSGGSKVMLSEGLYTKFPRPDYCLALHANGAIAAGKVGYTPGFAMANVDMVDITVYGEGGHGAYPHLTKDPVVLAANLVMNFQTIVSRETQPTSPAVLTVGSIHGGTKGNIIPNEVKMELTLRSYSDQVRNAMIEKIRRMCNGLAEAAGLPENKYPLVTVRDEYTPALYNTPDFTESMAALFRKTLGEANVVKVDASMGGEDFGRFGRETPKVPIMMYWLGTIAPEKVAESEKTGKPLPSLHTSTYAPIPEPSIKTGVLTMATAVIELLRQ